jgi:hypothetical protein
MLHPENYFNLEAPSPLANNVSQLPILKVGNMGNIVFSERVKCPLKFKMRVLGVVITTITILVGVFNLCLATARPAVTTNGTFSVLTYNVAGLPDILSSGNPAENTTTIGQRINSYDIVHVQEDFNYHADLYSTDQHPFRTSTSGPAGMGDGLNTVSNYSFSDFQRVDWVACNLQAMQYGERKRPEFR